MPLATDSVYCPAAGVSTGRPRSTKVIADWVLFPLCGCTLNGPLQFVPGVPVAHCAHEIPDNRLSMTANQQFFILSPDFLGDHGCGLVTVATFLATAHRRGYVVEGLLVSYM